MIDADGGVNPQERAVALRLRVECVIASALHPEQPESVEVVRRTLHRLVGSIPLTERRRLVERVMQMAVASMFDQNDHDLYLRALAALIAADQRHSVTDDAAMNAASGLRAAQPFHEFTLLTEAETGAWEQLTSPEAQWAAETLARALDGAR